MTARPSLVRSIPFWILLVGSLATGVLGAWLTVDKLAVMSTALTAGTATPVDVYVGQVWAIVGGILIATGIVGLALALVVAVVRSFVPATDVEIIEALDWSAEDDAHDDVPAAESETVAEAAPQR
ncbi:dinucleotide-utilizing enzyme [Microbacterium sp. zg.B48]|uniref:dinucleotide-utilizing enzyme n=1 Tax=Microbacterium sp. zg.B48 TaxID=2969408 RepID=UPI00214BC349|nr:dinucleotide-utilizing enzyme [Microbacterium sp. zg.B48]MCR2762145.1 dinucleotide-utilizing enzyme [Microbacterium sp. zg.B48]